MEDRFKEELCKETIDFAECSKMIHDGVDINRQTDEFENLLSGVLVDVKGKNLQSVIKFFIKNGFDVGLQDGKYGAMCLQALCCSSYDHHILEAAHTLIEAGAIDVPLENGDTALDIAATKQSYSETMESDYQLSNYFEAYVRMLDALHAGDSEVEIDVYHAAEGKCIRHVYAVKESNEGTFFEAEKYKNSFIDTLYFEYEKGFLGVDRYAAVWTTGKLPTGKIEDVSKRFKEIIGRSIKTISFEEVENVKGFKHCKTIIQMDSGRRICVTTNIGEVNDESEYRAHYTIEF